MYGLFLFSCEDLNLITWIARYTYCIRNSEGYFVCTECPSTSGQAPYSTFFAASYQQHWLENHASLRSKQSNGQWLNSSVSEASTLSLRFKSNALTPSLSEPTNKSPSYGQLPSTALKPTSFPTLTDSPIRAVSVLSAALPAPLPPTAAPTARKDHALVIRLPPRNPHARVPMVEHPGLKPSGFVIDVNLRLLICINCDEPTSVAPQNGLSHAANHPGTPLPSQVTYDELCDSYQLVEFQPPSAAVPPNPLFKRVDAYACRVPDCRKIVATLQALQRHFPKHHPGVDFLSNHDKIPAQAVSRFRGKPMYLEIDPSVDEPTLSSFEQLISSIPAPDYGKVTTYRAPSDLRQVNGKEYTLKWLKLLEGCDVQLLCDLVRPSAPELRAQEALFRTSITNYIQHVCALLDMMPVVVRRLINSWKS